MPHAIVMPEVSSKVSAILQGNRKAILRVWNRLFDQLENHVHVHRRSRDAEDSDLFNYVHLIYANQRWNRLLFSVNDTRAQDYLFVESVTEG
jgi:hypothetical protein